MTEASDSDADSIDSANINEATVQDVVRALRDCKGHYSFLIGAGTSKPAGIPTGGDLIWEWKQERYIEEHDDVDGADDVVEEEIERWANSYEDDHADQNSYGFWFEEVHTTPGQRRHLIREKVENKDPTFGNIVLASLMADQYVPLTLTPNFDDLVYDALYRFLEEKPLVINHDAVAAEFSLTKERPMIIKLHGDYLFQNLQNLEEETDKLQSNMERAFSLALNEYGLVVVGYGGDDTSIMDEVLLDDIEIPEYGIYWCARDRNELSDKAARLLDKENTYFVEISGSEALFTKLSKRIPGVSPPSDDDLKENAQEKIKAKSRTIEQRGKEAQSEEEEEYLDALKYRDKAKELAEAGEWEDLLDVTSEMTSYAPNNDTGYFYEGLAYEFLDDYTSALDSYQKAIDINEDGATYANRAETKIVLEDYEGAQQDALRAYESVNQSDRTAVCLLLLITAKSMLGKKKEKLEEEYRDICSKEFTADWDNTHLKRWMKETDIDDENKIFINEMISLLEQHIPNDE